MRYPVLMFDFGNVVGLFDYSQMYSRFGPRLGMPAAELRSVVRRRASPSWPGNSSGEIHPEEFMRTVIGLAGLEMSHDEFEAGWVDIFTLNEPVARLIAGLKRQGYTLVLGSNTNILHARFYRQLYAETLDHFDHFVFSYEVWR